MFGPLTCLPREQHADRVQETLSLFSPMSRGLPTSIVARRTRAVEHDLSLPSPVSRVLQPEMQCAVGGISITLTCLPREQGTATGHHLAEHPHRSDSHVSPP